MKSSCISPVSAKALGNGITLYREQQAPGLWKVWARLSLDVPLAEYPNVNLPEVEFLEKKLEEKYAHIIMEQLLTLFED